MPPVAPSPFAAKVAWFLPRQDRKTGGAVGRPTGFVSPTLRSAPNVGHRNPALFRVPTAVRFCAPLLGLVAACSNNSDSGTVANPKDAQSNADGVNTADTTSIADAQSTQDSAVDTAGEQSDLSTLDLINTPDENNSADLLTADVTIDVPQPPIPCTDSDKDFPDPTKITGGVVHYDQNGEKAFIPDTCKTPGILAEAICPPGANEFTKPSALVDFVFCNCFNGACVDKVFKPCIDPAPDKAINGAAIYQWDDKGVVVDACFDETSVRHITCDNDGFEKQDVTDCPPDKPCANGICGGVTCEDNDPENALDVKGTVEIKKNGLPSHLDDMCISTKWLWQSNCLMTSDPNLLSNSVAYFEQVDKNTTSVNCSASNGFCLDGVCVPGTPPTDPSNVCLPESDTDPAGDPYIAGTLAVASGEITKDGCINNIVLEPNDPAATEGTTTIASKSMEFACAEWAIPWEAYTVSCNPGDLCVNGACLVGSLATATCFDEDDGTGPLAGIKNDGTKVAWIRDECISPTQIREFHCQDNKLLWKITPCPPQSVCIPFWGEYPGSGHCVPCTDTDTNGEGGMGDLTVPGVATSSTGQTEGDYCVGDKVRQVYCKDDGSVDAAPPVACPTGKCDKGACQ